MNHLNVHLKIFFKICQRNRSSLNKTIECECEFSLYIDIILNNFSIKVTNLHALRADLITVHIICDRFSILFSQHLTLLALKVHS